MSNKHSGHLFVVNGDIQQLAVDAWLLPLDGSFSPTKTWQKTLDGLKFQRAKQVPWKRGELARFFARFEGTDVWIGNVGRSQEYQDEHPTHYTDVALQFLHGATQRWKDENPDEHRQPILAINHLGTGNGGARTSHGEVLNQIVNAISKELDSGDLAADVVLVSWGNKPWSAAQHMRHVRRPSWRTDPQWSFAYQQEVIHDCAERVAESLRRNAGCVFLGAGVSVGAGLKGWDQLLCDIGRETIPSTTEEDLRQFPDPRDKAALIETRLRRNGRSIGEVLQHHLQSEKYSLQHGLLASFPCNEYITTNVDELFEMACNVYRDKVAVIPQQPAGVGRWLLKLHGTVSQPESVVFTRDHYFDAFRSSRALMGLVQAMLFTRHMVFVGYGLRDEDFHELVYEVRSAFPGGKFATELGTAVALFDDPVQSELWSDMLSVVPMRPALNGRAPSNEEVAEAGRDAARLLDLIGMLASQRSSFLLDWHYEGARTIEENKAWREMEAVVELVRRTSTEGPGWDEVRTLLSNLGAEFDKENF